MMSILAAKNNVITKDELYSKITMKEYITRCARTKDQIEVAHYLTNKENFPVIGHYIINYTTGESIADIVFKPDKPLKVVEYKDIRPEMCIKGVSTENVWYPYLLGYVEFNCCCCQGGPYEDPPYKLFNNSVCIRRTNKPPTENAFQAWPWINLNDHPGIDHIYFHQVPNETEPNLVLIFDTLENAVKFMENFLSLKVNPIEKWVYTVEDVPMYNITFSKPE